MLHIPQTVLLRSDKIVQTDMLFQQLVRVTDSSLTVPAAVSPSCYMILNSLSTSKVQLHAKFFCWIFYECICGL